ncbi:recombinase family protein, partial [Escherichia coli]
MWRWATEQAHQRVAPSLLLNQRLSLKSSPHYLSTLTTQKGVFLMLIGYIRVSTNDQNTDLQ